MTPKFGTSGLRGLVTELTDDLVAAHVAGFAASCDTGGRLAIGRDLRGSSPHIADVVIATAHAAGLKVTDFGEIPTPALALAAETIGGGAIMITGSHIPDDRNGLKFYTAKGEITKEDETAIAAAVAQGTRVPSRPTSPPVLADGLAAYRDRYVTAFGTGSLEGMTVGLYEHSSVARDVLAAILSGLGADTVSLGRTDHFVPVDTEAVSADTRARLRAWAAEKTFCAIVSTDGDGDRPLIADPAGAVIPGDVLGLLAARYLGAEVVVTPVSSTTAIEASGAFAAVHRTRIGSPYVISGVEAARAADAAARVVGFEANGGFLLGWHAVLSNGALSPLMTRDAALPLVAGLMAARNAGGISALLASLPDRHTASDRLQKVDMIRTAALLTTLATDATARAAFFGEPETHCDLTDGLRLTFGDGRIVHLRTSGNAPELRCYAETGDAPRSTALVADTLAQAAKKLSLPS
jgi:phosphomannomutase